MPDIATIYFALRGIFILAVLGLVISERRSSVAAGRGLLHLSRPTWLLLSATVVAVAGLLLLTDSPPPRIYWEVALLAFAATTLVIRDLNS